MYPLTKIKPLTLKFDHTSSHLVPETEPSVGKYTSQVVTPLSTTGAAKKLSPNMNCCQSKEVQIVSGGHIYLSRNQATPSL